MGAAAYFIITLAWIGLVGAVALSIAGTVDLRISTLECKAGIHAEHHILQVWVLRAMDDTVECTP